MKGLLVTTAIFNLVIVGSAQAEIFKCQIDGKTTFSQTPCATDAQKLELKIYRPSDEAVQQAAEREKQLADSNETDRADRLKRQAKQEIVNTEKQIAATESQMEKELALLRAKKARANNNLAGAVYEQSISKEMDAVVTKYNAKIEVYREKISRLREKLND